MDDQAARLYCESQLRRRNNPPAVDVDDLVQEYLLAELQGECPKTAVGRVLKQSAKDARIVASDPSYRFAVEEEIDPDATEDEQAEYLEVEQEIRDEDHAERLEALQRLIGQLLPQEAQALRLVMDGATDEAVAVAMGVTSKQARYFREAGVGRLKKLAKPLKVKLPLGWEDEVAEPRTTYKRKAGARYKPQVTDVILGRAG